MSREPEVVDRRLDGGAAVRGSLADPSSLIGSFEVDVLLSAGRRIALGLLLVGIGASILVDRVNGMKGDLTVYQLLWRWWPLVVVIAGCVRLFRMERPWQLIRPLSVIAVGVLLLLITNGLVKRYLSTATDQYLPLLWPLAIVVAGFWIALVGAEWGGRSTPDHDGLHKSVWFRGEAEQPEDDFQLRGIRVVLGYLRLDLRGLPWAEGLAVLDVTAILGRIHLMVPEGLKVERREAFVLGNQGLHYTNEAPRPHERTQLMVNVVGVLGSVVVEESAAAPTGDDESHAAS